MDNAHKNHRARMFQRLGKDGPNAFHDHELLEMLLYFSIPRGNTNPTAHKLLKEFGDIGGVFDADTGALKSIDGIGEKSAILINLAGELYRRGLARKELRGSFRITNTAEASTYCKTLFLGKKYECFFAVCLDIKGKVVSDGYICEGVIDSVPAYARKVVETALRHTAHTVVIAHNHPRGDCRPSVNDDIVTQNCKTALEAIGIALNDHIIIGEDGYYSYANDGRMGEKSIDTTKVAQKKRIK